MNGAKSGGKYGQGSVPERLGDREYQRTEQAKYHALGQLHAVRPPAVRQGEHAGDERWIQRPSGGSRLGTRVVGKAVKLPDPKSQRTVPVRIQDCMAGVR